MSLVLMIRCPVISRTVISWMMYNGQLIAFATPVVANHHVTAPVINYEQVMHQLSCVDWLFSQTAPLLITLQASSLIYLTMLLNVPHV